MGALGSDGGAAVTKVVTARTNRGPCETCGKEIEPGQRYRTTRGRALPGEEPLRRADGALWMGGLHYVEGIVSFRRHEGCPYPENRK